MSDPGFLSTGVPSPEKGVKPYYLVIFLPKTAWKWKKLDRDGGAHVWRPLDPPMCKVTANTITGSALCHFVCKFRRNTWSCGGGGEEEGIVGNRVIYNHIWCSNVTWLCVVSRQLNHPLCIYTNNQSIGNNKHIKPINPVPVQLKTNLLKCTPSELDKRTKITAGKCAI